MYNEKDIKKDIKKVNNIVDLFLLSFSVDSVKGELIPTQPTYIIPYDIRTLTRKYNHHGMASQKRTTQQREYVKSICPKRCMITDI